MPVYKKQNSSKQNSITKEKQLPNKESLPQNPAPVSPAPSQPASAAVVKNKQGFVIPEVTPEKLMQGIIYQEILGKPLAKRRRR